MSTEKTDKRYKMAMLVCAGLAILSVPMCMGGVMDRGPDDQPGALGTLLVGFGTLMFLGGIGGFVAVRVLAWWKSG